MSINKSDAQRSEQVKIATYGREVWAVAQQRESKYKMHTAMQSLDGGNFKLFPKDLKRSYRKKAGGVQDTPISKHDATRRAVFSQSFDNGLAIDKDDMVDNQVSLESRARQADEAAAGRLCDTIILSALVSPVYETSDSTDTLRGDGQLTADLSLSVKHRVNTWVRGDGSKEKIAALTADDLEDIGYIFAQRGCRLQKRRKRVCD